MAGGPTTVTLAQAAADAGAFPVLAAGYKTVEAIAAEVEALRATVAGFGVNMFVPSTGQIDPVQFRAYAAELQPEADVYELTLGSQPVEGDDRWDAKLALLLERPVPVVSFTFGLPEPAVIKRLQEAGTLTLATVTTPDEGRAAEALGVDGLVVQGPSAGGHSGTFDPLRTIGAASTPSVVKETVGVSRLPVIAGGGIDGPAAVSAVIAAGAQAAAVGTLLLRTDESGASAAHKAALGNPAFTETVITHAFTGRPARGLHNGFIDRHEPTAPYGYPAIHHLTRELRAAATRAGDTDRIHLWSGTGFRAARGGPVADVIRELANGL
jgi:NAD(P)H-dependent flavin oxidoreductase YrpB (nitropropane dioxygenase family)